MSSPPWSWWGLLLLLVLLLMLLGGIEGYRAGGRVRQRRKYREGEVQELIGAVGFQVRGFRV